MPRSSPPDDAAEDAALAHAKTTPILVDEKAATAEITTKRNLDLAPIGEFPSLSGMGQLPGDKDDDLPRYEQIDKLGQGGMGEVGLYKDRRLGREVALKTLLPEQVSSDAAKKRFLREARVQGQLEHPSVVPVYDLEQSEDGGFFFTMRRVRGMTLEEIVKRLKNGPGELSARYTRRKLLTAFVSVCLAVDYAHNRDVLHRDLKPANVMLGDFGEVYVLDWGIAKGVAAKERKVDAIISQHELTAKGHVMGTAAYASPEQIAGQRDSLDARTDVYGLGLILFEILALEPLFTGARLGEILDAKFGDTDPRPSARARDVPPELDAICVKATMREKKDRFASAREMGDAIERYLDGDADLERQREIAAEHAKSARTAIAQARKKGTAPEAAQAARVAAVSDLLMTLALDPSDTEARKMMLELLTDVPETAPSDAIAEMGAADARARRRARGLGVRALLGILALAAASIVSAGSSPIGYAAIAGALVLAIASTFWMWSGVSSALKSAERRMFLSGWQLRRLIPHSVPQTRSN